MHLIYQAYGREDVIRQTLFSVTSLLYHLRFSQTLTIVIYTDQILWLEKFFKNHSKVKFVEMDAAMIRRYRGTIDFVHRVKIEVLMDAAKRFAGPLFYVDGDTYFRADPTKLFSQVDDQISLMHVAENRLQDGKDPLSKKLVKFVKHNTFGVNGENVKLSPELVMWNAGAVGLSAKNTRFLPLILELTDKAYGVYPKHVIEQLAFSYYLQTYTKVISAEKEIGHYWDQKEQYQTLIDPFLLTNDDIDLAIRDYPNFLKPLPKEKSQSSRAWPWRCVEQLKSFWTSN